MGGIVAVSLPAAVMPLLGSEQIPADTGAAAGVQTEYITPEQIKDFVFGNSAEGTASATAGAATLNAGRGKITSEALTTAAGAVYTLTLTDSRIAAADLVFASVANGTNTQGVPAVGRVSPAAGSVAIEIRNEHASQALNGTLVISFFVIKTNA